MCLRRMSSRRSPEKPTNDNKKQFEILYNIASQKTTKIGKEGLNGRRTTENAGRSTWIETTLNVNWFMRSIKSHFSLPLLLTDLFLELNSHDVRITIEPLTSVKINQWFRCYSIRCKWKSFKRSRSVLLQSKWIIFNHFVWHFWRVQLQINHFQSQLRQNTN